MHEEFVRVETADCVATVTLERPPVNALNLALQNRIIDVFDRLSDEPSVRAIVFTGAGSTFTAGADIKARAGMTFGAGERWSHNRSVRECFHAVMECRKPVVAAINGPALGGGLALIASADILVASTRASVGLPEIDVGLLGGGRHAMRLFGHSMTRRMMLTGHRLSGEDLYRLGVVDACVEPEELMHAATGIARQIAAKSPTAVRLAKEALNAIEEMSLRDGYRYEQNMTAQLAGHPDAREAMQAFAERRAPVFGDGG